jgi:sulfite exporter TauE/SafE
MNKQKMKNQRRIAIITGISLILMALIAIFSIGYAYTQFDNPEQSEFLKNNILQNRGLYQSMLLGILVIIILDFIVSYTLYKYFVGDHQKMSMVSGIIRAIYTLIFAVATYYLTKNLNTSELTNQIASSNYQKFQTIWNSGLVVFGFHIILIGWLMKLHRKIPKILWYITFVAGVSYVITSFLKVVSPDSEMVETLIMALALPMTIGELGLAIWLWIKGGKETRIENETSR